MRRPWMIMKVNKLTQETMIKFGLELETTSSGKYYKVPSRCSFKDRLTTLIFFKKSWNFPNSFALAKSFSCEIFLTASYDEKAESLLNFVIKFASRASKRREKKMLGMFTLKISSALRIRNLQLCRSFSNFSS